MANNFFIFVDGHCIFCLFHLLAPFELLIFRLWKGPICFGTHESRYSRDCLEKRFLSVAFRWLSSKQDPWLFSILALRPLSCCQKMRRHYSALLTGCKQTFSFRIKHGNCSDNFKKEGSSDNQNTLLWKNLKKTESLILILPKNTVSHLTLSRTG